MGARRWAMLGRSADAPPVGIVIASGAALVTAAAFVAAAIPATAPAIRLGVLAMALAGYAAWTVDPRAVAAVTGLAALVCNGFLVNQLGELSWHGTADAVRLVVLSAAAATGFAAGAGYRMVRRALLWRARHQQVAQWAADTQADRAAARAADTQGPELVWWSGTVPGGRERRDG